MSDKKQSSIDWLVEMLMKGEFINNTDELIEQAKAMHKEEIEEAHYDGSIITLLNPDSDMLKLSKQYYNETFGDEKEVL